MPTTADLDLPYPGPGDPANVPAFIFDLAARIEEVLASGIYTPTLANLANCAGTTTSPWRWTKIGNVVTVSGRLTIDPIEAGTTETVATLPLASDLPSTHSLSGIASPGFDLADDAGFIEAHVASDMALISINATSTSIVTVNVDFTYTFDPVP